MDPTTYVLRSTCNDLAALTVEARGVRYVQTATEAGLWALGGGAVAVGLDPRFCCIRADGAPVRCVRLRRCGVLFSIFYTKCYVMIFFYMKRVMTAHDMSMNARELS